MYRPPTPPLQDIFSFASSTMESDDMVQEGRWREIDERASRMRRKPMVEPALRRRGPPTWSSASKMMVESPRRPRRSTSVVKSRTRRDRASRKAPSRRRSSRSRRQSVDRGSSNPDSSLLRGILEAYATESGAADAQVIPLADARRVLIYLGVLERHSELEMDAWLAKQSKGQDYLLVDTLLQHLALQGGRDTQTAVSSAQEILGSPIQQMRGSHKAPRRRRRASMVERRSSIREKNQLVLSSPNAGDLAVVEPLRPTADPPTRRLLMKRASPQSGRNPNESFSNAIDERIDRPSRWGVHRLRNSSSSTSGIPIDGRGTAVALGGWVDSTSQLSANQQIPHLPVGQPAPSSDLSNHPFHAPSTPTQHQPKSSRRRIFQISTPPTTPVPIDSPQRRHLWPTIAQTPLAERRHRPSHPEYAQTQRAIARSTSRVSNAFNTSNASLAFGSSVDPITSAPPISDRRRIASSPKQISDIAAAVHDLAATAWLPSGHGRRRTNPPTPRNTPVFQTSSPSRPATHHLSSQNVSSLLQWQS